MTRPRWPARPAVAALLAVLLALPGAARPGPGGADPADRFTRADGAQPFARPVPMDEAAQSRFDLGQSFFRVPWVPAPAATTARDGLGPLFTANACAACHPANGSAPVLDKDRAPLRPLVVKLGQPGAHTTLPPAAPGTAPATRRGDPVYGGVLSSTGTARVPAEGRLALDWTDSAVISPDGRTVRLERPAPRLTGLADGPLDAGTVVALRQPPALAGLGLIEAVDDAEILRAADPEDRDGDGISGRPNRIAGRLGRYGWKAAEPGLVDQVANAAAFDMGLTNPLYPEETCTPAQTACRAAPAGRPGPDGGTLDLPQPRLDAIAAYLAGHRAPASPPGTPGEALFAAIGCTACHRDEMTTRDGLAFRPFGDYLLHDMGEGLADGLPEAEATGREFRTSPLWGLGARVRAGHRFLHDARAASPEAAILWHGGEAEAARAAFLTLDPASRDAILTFLETL